MGLLDKDKQIAQAPLIEQHAAKIRFKLANAIDSSENALKTVRRLVAKHGKTAMIAELGDDAAELGQVYNLLRTLVETVDDTKTIPNYDADDEIG